MSLAATLWPPDTANGITFETLRIPFRSWRRTISPLGTEMSRSLIRPSPEFEPSYREYIRELGDEERYPFPLDFDHSDFAALLQRLADLEAGENLPSGYVSSSTYWLAEGEEIVGVSNLRHTLNQEIKWRGGHIGLGVRQALWRVV
jgi:predicted acetyltransferase